MACPIAETKDKVVVKQCPKFLVNRGKARSRARTVIHTYHDRRRDGRGYILGDNHRDSDNNSPSNITLHSKDIRLATGNRGRPTLVEQGKKRRYHHHRHYNRRIPLAIDTERIELAIA